MGGQTSTILNGVVVLVVFTLVGWNLRGKRTHDEQGRSNKGVGNER